MVHASVDPVRVSVVSAVCLDSRTNDLLQVADVVAGAIHHERKLVLSPYASRSSKGQVARKLAMAFGRPQLADGRDARLNIATYRGRAARSATRFRAG